MQDYRLSDSQPSVRKITPFQLALKQRRFGRFVIDRVQLEDFPDDVRLIVADGFVTRCESMWDFDQFQYSAVNPKFRALSNGEMPPKYSVAVKDDQVIWTELPR